MLGSYNRYKDKSNIIENIKNKFIAKCSKHFVIIFFEGCEGVYKGFVRKYIAYEVAQEALFAEKFFDLLLTKAWQLTISKK